MAFGFLPIVMYEIPLRKPLYIKATINLFNYTIIS